MRCKIAVLTAGLIGVLVTSDASAIPPPPTGGGACMGCDCKYDPVDHTRHCDCVEVAVGGAADCWFWEWRPDIMVCDLVAGPCIPPNPAPYPF